MPKLMWLTQKYFKLREASAIATCVLGLERFVLQTQTKVSAAIL